MKLCFDNNLLQDSYLGNWPHLIGQFHSVYDSYTSLRSCSTGPRKYTASHQRCTLFLQNKNSLTGCIPGLQIWHCVCHWSHLLILTWLCSIEIWHGGPVLDCVGAYLAALPQNIKWMSEATFTVFGLKVETSKKTLNLGRGGLCRSLDFFQVVRRGVDCPLFPAGFEKLE